MQQRINSGSRGGYQNTAADQQWQQAGYQNTAADQQWQQAGYQNAAADQQWSQGQQYDRQPYTTVPPYNQPPVYPIPQAVTEMNTKVGTFTYFGLILLFAIPVIGWIACLVMCFASKNDNIKSFARAVLIWLIIGVAFAVVSGIIIAALNRLLDFVQSQLGELANIKDLISQFTQFDLSSFGMDGLDMESLMEGYDLTGIPIE